VLLLLGVDPADGDGFAFYKGALEAEEAEDGGGREHELEGLVGGEFYGVGAWEAEGGAAADGGDGGRYGAVACGKEGEEGR